LAGGHDIDCHFVETNPRHNLPVLLALADVWNDVFLGNSSSGRILTPYSQAMKAFPAFVAALEAQTCSTLSPPAAENHQHNPNRLSCSSLVLDGGTDSAYDRSLYQSSKILNSEIVMVMNAQLKANAIRNLGGATAQGRGMEDVFHHADALMCSLFGHVDEMAFGAGEDPASTVKKNSAATGESSLQLNTSMPSGNNSASQSASEGNRPSTLLMVSTLDAFACGQLIALSEHRAVVKARIWDIDPFTHENASSLKTARTDQLREDLQKISQTVGESEEEENDDGDGSMSLSTKTILGHYANMTRDQRVHAK
jgi:glucose-6-phosphate isomerase